MQSRLRGAVLLSVAFALQVPAQNVVSGDVRDQGGAFISGAVVHLLTPRLSDTTDAQGRFAITVPFTELQPRVVSSALMTSPVVEGGTLKLPADNSTRMLEVAIHALDGRVVGGRSRVVVQPGAQSIDLRTFMAGATAPRTSVVTVVLAGKTYRYRMSLAGSDLAARGTQTTGQGATAMSKSAGADAISDTLVFTKSNYNVKKVAITSYSVNVGTVTMTPVAAGPVLSGPATSTGAFTLSWTFSGWSPLGSTSDRYQLEESTTSSTSGFTLIVTTTMGQRPTTYSQPLTRSSGTYYYRVRAYSGTGFTPYSNVVTVRVTQQQPTLRIVNNTHYAMVDIRLNGTQHVGTGSGIDVDGQSDFTFTSGGTVNYVLGVGLWENSVRNVWFTLNGSTTVTAGQTTTITFNNPTLGDLLTNFSTQRTWSGVYWVNATPGSARYVFQRNGNWSLYDNNVFNASGTATLVSWPDYGTIVTFKLCSTCANINLAYPFASFMYRNGPTSWPVIEYVAQ